MGGVQFDVHPLGTFGAESVLVVHLPVVPIGTKTCAPAFGVVFVGACVVVYFLNAEDVAVGE